MLKRFLLFLLAFTAFANVYAQAPDNDDCEEALTLPSVKSYCSAAGQFTTVGASPTFSNSGNDVWFKVTAQTYNLFVTVSGSGFGGTLVSPNIGLYTDCSGSGVIGTVARSGNLTTFNVNGLIIGRSYYIQVSGSNSGTFKLCFNNEDPILQPGQDCSGASVLCSKETFTQTTLTGPGMNANEAIGTCLDVLPGRNSENNSAWYKWTAANNGTLVFTLTPVYKSDGVNWDDLDWVLYDLGTSDNCSLSGKTIRCAAGSGVDNRTRCPGEPEYFKTGLDFGAGDIEEKSGCGAGQDGKIKFVDMIQGHIYALLVNNFTPGNNGFILEFKDQNGVTGTGEFVGPKAPIAFSSSTPCIAGQTFTFSTQPTGTSAIKWTFGDPGDAFIVGSNTPVATATGNGPYTISYKTLGLKTVVLEAFGPNGCETITVQPVSVGVKPLSPVVNASGNRLCTGDTLRLSATPLRDAIYIWTGPAGFNAMGRSISIPLISTALNGTYTVTITQYGCTSDPGTYTVSGILDKPVAAFTTSPALPAKLSFPVSVKFTNKSTGSDKWLWNFGDGSTSTEESPEHTYLGRGDYTVTLTATNGNSCSASVMHGTFVVRAYNSLFIPNTFTPNGDGVNDELVITLTNTTNYHITIFTRWGAKVFESASIFENWNGKVNSKDLPVGTYYYLITAIDADNENVKRSGSVTLIR